MKRSTTWDSEAAKQRSPLCSGEKPPKSAYPSLRSNPAREGVVIARVEHNPDAMVKDSPRGLIPTRRPDEFEEVQFIVLPTEWMNECYSYTAVVKTSKAVWKIRWQAFRGRWSATNSGMLAKAFWVPWCWWWRSPSTSWHSEGAQQRSPLCSSTAQWCF
jgi:hypothetical protein